MQVNLPDVTLVCVDLSCHELTALAVHECMLHASFGDVKIFNPTKDMYCGEYIEGLNFSNFLEFSLYELPYRVKTSHILWIHWDSWIIDPAMWRDEFLAYDYIGAPWWFKDGMNVGNSGFHIRSIRLMKFLTENRKEFTFSLSTPEDYTLCKTYRPKLTQFTWAPEATAQDFAFERTRPSIESRHFGFHGVFNWPFVLPPRRLKARMDLARANEYISKSGQLNELDRLSDGMWRKLSTGKIQQKRSPRNRSSACHG